jgi:hypothetical protein
MHAIYKAGNDDERALADWMVTLCLVPEQAESTDPTAP